MEILSKRFFSLFLVLVLVVPISLGFLNSCSNSSGKDDDIVHQAQRCFNDLAGEPNGEERNTLVDECLEIISDVTSAKSYGLRCAAMYIKQGVLATSDDAARAYQNSQNSSVLLAMIAFEDQDGVSKEDLIEETVVLCEKSTIQSYVTLAHSSKLATIILGSGIGSINPDESSEEIERRVQDSLNDFRTASPERKEAVAATARQLHNNDCQSGSQSSSPLCQQLDTIFSDLPADATNTQIADAISDEIGSGGGSEE